MTLDTTDIKIIGEQITSVREAVEEQVQWLEKRWHQGREDDRRLFEQADKRYEQRFIASQEAITAALLAQKEAVNAALVAADRAVIKAETASEKRFEGVNEFRQSLADQAANLMPRREAEERFNSLGEKLIELTTSARDMGDRLREDYRKDIAEIRALLATVAGNVATGSSASLGRATGVQQSWGVFLAVAGLALAVGSLVTAIALR